MGAKGAGERYSDPHQHCVCGHSNTDHVPSSLSLALGRTDPLADLEDCVYCECSAFQGEGNMKR